MNHRIIYLLCLMCYLSLCLLISYFPNNGIKSQWSLSHKHLGENIYRPLQFVHKDKMCAIQKIDFVKSGAAREGLTLRKSLLEMCCMCRPLITSFHVEASPQRSNSLFYINRLLFIYIKESLEYYISIVILTSEIGLSTVLYI